jgi:hypothetical protein
MIRMEADDESENGSEDESEDEVDDTSSMTFASEKEEKLGGSIDVDRANVGKFSKVHFRPQVALYTYFFVDWRRIRISVPAFLLLFFVPIARQLKPRCHRSTNQAVRTKHTLSSPQCLRYPYQKAKKSLIDCIELRCIRKTVCFSLTSFRPF